MRRDWHEEEDRECLNNLDASQCRALAARVNHFVLDRPDVQCAVKEIRRGMNNHTRGDFHRLRRFGRYLVRSTPEVFAVSSSRKPAESYPVRSHRFRWGGCRERGPGARAVGFSGDDTPFRHGPPPRKNVILSSRRSRVKNLQIRAQRWDLRREEEAGTSDTLRMGFVGFKRKMRFGNSSNTPNKKVQGNSAPADLMMNVNRRTLGKMAALFQQHFKEGRVENSQFLPAVETSFGRGVQK